MLSGLSVVESVHDDTMTRPVDVDVDVDIDASTERMDAFNCIFVLTQLLIILMRHVTNLENIHLENNRSTVNKIVTQAR